MSKQNTIFGIKLTDIGITGLIDQILVWVSEGNLLRVVNNLNVHAISLANKDLEFRKALNQSDIVFCDGYGVKIAAKILGVDVGERMTPPDWIDDLFKIAENKSFKLYFLGDENSVIHKFVLMIKEKYPNLIVVGFHHGFIHNDIRLSEQVVRDISSKTIDVLVVGMGMPLQEMWIVKNKKQLNAKVTISVGALFRWYTKTEKRGPKFLTDNGFEWLTRLLIQPRKVWKRYIYEIPCFFILVLKERIRYYYSCCHSEKKHNYSDVL